MVQSRRYDFVLKNEDAIRDWIISSINEEKKQLQEVNIIFCDDDSLLQKNKSFLKKQQFWSGRPSPPGFREPDLTKHMILKKTHGFFKKTLNVFSCLKRLGTF
mgnify:CR=1 FL=1